jgi:hypothetical protein
LSITNTLYFCGYCGKEFYNIKECPSCTKPLIKRDAATGFKTHSTGATRSTDKDKYRYDLISPIAIKTLAEVLKEGADKYGDFNWENGFPVTDILNHALGHIFDFLSGDRSEDHLGHLLANAMFAVHSMNQWPHLNDNLRLEGCVLPEKFCKKGK